MDELIDLAEAARRLGRNVSTVRGWVDEGRVAVAKRVPAPCAGRRVRLVRWAEIEAYARRVGGSLMSKGVRAARKRSNDREPSQAEVDALVAEGYANLPSWWGFETARPPELTVPLARVPAAYARRVAGECVEVAREVPG